MIIDFMAANGLNLLVLGAVAFIQNMFFTWSSRSRNSGDPGYHRKVAWGSNGVWYLCQMLIIKQVWSAIQAGNMALVALAGLVYVIATSESTGYWLNFISKGLISTAGFVVNWSNVPSNCCFTAQRKWAMSWTLRGSWPISSNKTWIDCPSNRDFRIFAPEELSF